MSACSRFGSRLIRPVPIRKSLALACSRSGIGRVGPFLFGSRPAWECEGAPVSGLRSAGSAATRATREDTGSRAPSPRAAGAQSNTAWPTCRESAVAAGQGIGSRPCWPAPVSEVGRFALFLSGRPVPIRKSLALACSRSGSGRVGPFLFGSRQAWECEGAPVLGLRSVGSAATRATRESTGSRAPSPRREASPSDPGQEPPRRDAKRRHQHARQFFVALTSPPS
ncbi:hypothetical protein SAMN05421505_10669 [Sinosporangium album]|uniref:Uncharacterized protein n=1 Tax=Sinosporangium album TaxID=504805 RepID=A0A1G7VV18_9ACTN|nr:hypothetical protein SAMN05421505_10669 [Sinosporangium album]